MHCTIMEKVLIETLKTFLKGDITTLLEDGSTPEIHYGKGGSLSTPRYAPVLAGVAAADTGIFMGTNYGGAMGTELKPGPI